MKTLSNALIVAIALGLSLSWAGCRTKTADDEPAGREAIVKRLQELDKAYQANPGDQSLRADYVRVLLQQARMHDRDGKPAEAEAAYRKALDLDPDNNAAALYLGSLLIKSGQHQKGVDLLEQLIRRNPAASENVYNILAEGYRGLGDREQEEKALLKSLALNPASRDAYRMLVQLWRSQGKEEQAKWGEDQIEMVTARGFPDRGYREKTLKEWQAEARPGRAPAPVDDEEEEEEPEFTGHRKGKPGPMAQAKAIALYNTATHLDLAIDHDDYFSIERAMKAWGAYMMRSREVEGEESYRKVIKERRKVLKKIKKEASDRLGLHALEELRSEINKLALRIANINRGLEQATQIAADRNDHDLAGRVEQLKAQWEQAVDESLPLELKAMAQQVTALMKKKQQDPEAEVNVEAARIDGRLDELTQAAVERGVVEVDEEIMALCAELNIRMPRRGGYDDDDD